MERVHRISVFLVVILGCLTNVLLAESSSQWRWAGVERVVAVGDVHGAYPSLLELLQASQLLSEKGHWSGGKAHLVMLGDLLDRSTDQLSGGQEKRVALARALVAKPRVIVLDDALSAVNPAHEMEIIRRVAAFLPDSAVVAISRRPGPAEVADIVVELGERPLETSAATAENGASSIAARYSTIWV